MTDLQKQIDDLTARALTFLNEGNENKCRVLMEQADQLKKQLAEQNGAIAQPEEAPKEEFEHVKLYGLDFDAYAETGSDILNTWAESMLNHQHLEIHKRYNDMIEQLTGKVNSLSLENESLTSTNKVNEGRIQQMGESNLAMVEEKNRYKIERDDLENRFNAAAEELRITKEEQLADMAEIERLKRRETELQETIARAPAPTASFIDIESTASEFDPEELIRKAQEIKKVKEERKEEERKAKLIKITNIRWEDPNNRTFKLAELVLNGPTGIDGQVGKSGDTIRIHYFNVGKYLEVSEEEAGRFRAEAVQYIKTPTADISLVDAVIVPSVEPVEQFREEETGSILVEGSQVADEQPGVQLSTEERLAKLEKLVQGLEEDVAILYGKTGQVA